MSLNLPKVLYGVTLVIIEGEEEFEVEKILNKQVV